MVREVGFEPTNPYGTGASGLRVQDPYSRRVSLTWLGNTSRPITRRTPANTRPAPAKTQTQTTPLIGFRQSTNPIKTGQCLIEPRPGTPHKPYLSKLTGTMSLWPPGEEKQDDYAVAGATAGDDPDNTATAECKEDTATPDGNATAGAASFATAGRSEKQASHPSTQNTNEQST